MKAHALTALVAAALVLFNLSACSTVPDGHSDSTAINAGDNGPNGGDIGSGSDNTDDVSKADADASSQSDNDSSTDVASNKDVDASADSTTDKDTEDSTDTAAPACPKAGDDPKATLEIMLADGPQCFVPGSDEAIMASDFMNAKVGLGTHPKANMKPASEPDPIKPNSGCATIGNPNDCFPLAQILGKGYKPQLWDGQTVPFEVSMYLHIKFPDSDPPKEIEVGRKKCSDGICEFEDVEISLYQWKVVYTVKTKVVTVTLVHKGKAGSSDIYKLNE